MESSGFDRIVALLERIVIALENPKAQMPCDEQELNPPPYKTRMKEYAICLAWAKSTGLKDVRMAKSLARAGISSFNDVTIGRLDGIKNCGDLTKQKLLAWAEQNAKR